MADARDRRSCCDNRLGACTDRAGHGGVGCRTQPRCQPGAQEPLRQGSAAKALGAKAKAVLVFPKITKAGLGVGGQYGDGALLKGGKAVAYYNTSGVSSGLQAGAQQYGYAMFFMNQAALKALDSTQGFEVGVGPSVVVMDEGKAKSTTTTTMKDDIYAFIFSQQGLMAGLGLQGNKITKINPK